MMNKSNRMILNNRAAGKLAIHQHRIGNESNSLLTCLRGKFNISFFVKTKFHKYNQQMQINDESAYDCH